MTNQPKSMTSRSAKIVETEGAKKVLSRSGLFNEQKLTPIFETMAQKSVLVVGGGAIGSFICEMCVRNGVKYTAVLDKDYYEQDNIPKSSFVIRYPEDIGKSKAHALADNLSVRCKEGCSIRGFNYDLKKIGPLAMAEFDYVILALDNLAMKIFAQKLIKLCPEQRPIVLSCGTTGEFSEAMMFAPNGACVRCTIPDEWLLSENPETVHSCAAKVNYLLPQKTLPVVSTSGIASMKSAIDIDEMVTSHAMGINPLTKSQRYVQSPYPNKNGHSTFIAPLANCPVCAMTPPSDVTTLKGSTDQTTLRELLTKISAYYDGPFRLKVHILEIPGVPEQIYDQYVLKEKCRVCGEDFVLNKHTGDLRQSQIVCGDCSERGEAFCRNFDNRDALAIREFSLEETPDSVLDQRLFDLGYPIGCYYETVPANDPVLEKEICLSAMEDEEETEEVAENQFFCLNQDRLFFMEE